MLRLDPSPPLEITRLVEPDPVEHLTDALATHRMTAVVGPPGVGKSRRLAEAVRSLATRDTELRRALWVGLEGTTDGGAPLTTALTLALDVVPGRADDADQVLVRALAIEPVLVVLDGVDGVLDALLPRLADWLARVPTLRVATTSQRRPELLGAVTHRVDPLAQDVALELLGDRLTAAAGGRPPDPGDRPVLTRIVDQLDGLPLAIELVAPRIALLGAAAMARQLETSGAMLDLSARSVTRGQTSLRGALEAAWSLLDEPARQTWMRCSVFAHTFGLDDLAALCDDTGGDPIDALARLCDASLVMRADVPGHFRLLGALRRFATDALDAHPELAARVRARHRAHLAAWAARCVARVEDPDGAEALAELRARRAELERAADDEIDAAIALGHVLHVEASADVHAAHLDALAARLEPGTPEAGRVALRRQRAHFVLRDHDRAMAIAREALDDAPEDPDLRDALRAFMLRVRLQDEPGAATAIRADIAALRQTRAERPPAAVDGELAVLQGVAAMFADDLQAALEHLDEAVGLHTRHGTPAALVLALHNRATAALWQGRPHRARRDLERALEQVRALGPRHGQQINALIRLGWVCLDLGDRARAVAHLDEACSLARVLGRPEELLHAELLLGTAALDAGDLGAARTWLERARAATDTTDDPVYGVRVGLELAELARLGGDPGLARTHLEAVLERTRDDAGQAYAIAARACLAAVEAADGDHDRAADLIGQAERGLEKLWLPTLSEHVALQRACVDWMGGRLDRDALVEVLARVLTPRDDLPSAWHSSATTRQAVRHLLRAVPDDLRDAVVRQAIDPDGQALIVDRSTSPVTFRMPGAEAFDVGRRALLERLLLALVEHHGDDTPVDLDTMVAAGWPGEQILPDAAANRLHKALSGLRRLPGVRDALVTVDGGWQLDPALRLVELPLD